MSAKEIALQKSDKLVTFMYILTVAIPLVKGKDGCRDLEYLNCVQNKTLTGHVISNFSLPLPALEKCQHQCFLEGKCVSYNLGPVRGHSRPCELNAADHSTRPTFLATKKGSEYCAIRNPCLSYPCPSGRHCIPDLSWDTFNCDDGAWTQWGPWTGCFLPSTCTPTRSRNCTSPVPQHNGAKCTGPAMETRECHVPQFDLTGCDNPLGMEDRSISNGQITASSYHASKGSTHAPWRARLNNKKISGTTIGAWGPLDPKTGDYIQIDLGSVKVITKVATQGRPFGDKYEQWVSKYSLSYSNDTKKWSNYDGDCMKVFDGNRDRNTIVTNRLEVPIRAKHIRLIVKEFQGHPILRMELYGCSLDV